MSSKHRYLVIVKQNTTTTVHVILFTAVNHITRYASSRGYSKRKIYKWLKTGVLSKQITLWPQKFRTKHWLGILWGKQKRTVKIRGQRPSTNERFYAPVSWNMSIRSCLNRWKYHVKENQLYDVGLTLIKIVFFVCEFTYVNKRSRRLARWFAIE